MRRDVPRIAGRVVGPFARHCSACGLQPTDAYVTTPLIGIGVTGIPDAGGEPGLLEQILAFDKAEASFANITQTNLIRVSSFNGPQGLLLGYDLLKQDLRRHPLVEETRYPHVFDAEPLFAATRALYGTVREKRFPLLPGQPLLCAYKTLYATGPCLVYGALAVALPEDRSENADLFLEDHGRLEAGTEPSALLSRLIDAAHKIGDNLGIAYARLFIGLRCQRVLPGELACVLTAAPYVHLAQDAVPHGRPERLAELTLRQWEDAVQAHYLNNGPCPSSSPPSTTSPSSS